MSVKLADQLHVNRYFSQVFFGEHWTPEPQGGYGNICFSVRLVEQKVKSSAIRPDIEDLVGEKNWGKYWGHTEMNRTVGQGVSKPLMSCWPW